MRGATLLLDTLHGLGVEVRPAGDKVAYRPIDAVKPELLAEIRRHKTELLVLLRAGEESAAAADSVERARWVVSAPLSEPLTKECFACRGLRWWRLRSPGCEWVCERCHPPGPPPDQIEWLGGTDEASPRTNAAARLEREIDEALARVDPGAAAQVDRADWRERYEERAAIHEHDAGMPREQAEALALQATVSALRDRLGLQATVPVTAGEVARG